MNHEDEELIKTVIKLLRDIPKYNPYFVSPQLDEENDLDSKLKMKDAMIEHLKDRIRIEQDRNRSLSNQLKIAKQQKK